ncbi:MAG: hypothetical protein VW405_04125 [Rhodospirillaceae bacterium]
MSALRKLSRALRRGALLAALFVAVSGCYMPMRFDAEIEVTRAGYFSFIFDGYLAKVELYDALRRNKMTPNEQREEIEKIRADFARDANASEFAYHRSRYFRVHWEHKGNILKSKTATLFRRNEYMLGIAYNSETGRVGVTRRSLNRDTKNKLNEIGLDGTNGEIRVITDANVLTHNATKVTRNATRGPGFKAYVWKIANIYAPTPSIIIAHR